MAGSDRSILITGLKGYDDEDSANARLIAAAPALLEACAETERLIRLTDGKLGPHDVKAALNLLCEVIAKAEGRA